MYACVDIYVYMIMYLFVYMYIYLFICIGIPFTTNTALLYSIFDYGLFHYVILPCRILSYLILYVLY